MDASSFTAGADYGIYAATMTGVRAGSAATSLDILASNSTVVHTTADDEGGIGKASNMGGAALATIETYHLMARQFTPASLHGTICPYDFFVRVLSGSPIPAMGPNDDVPPVPRSNGWRCRAINEPLMKRDGFAIAVNASDTIGVIVGVDLERGAPEWKMMAGAGMFAGSFIMTL